MHGLLSSCTQLSVIFLRGVLSFCDTQHSSLLTNFCAAKPGTIMAVGAAVATALAFLAVGAIPKSEPALVVAMWFHVSALLTAAVALTVGACT